MAAARLHLALALVLIATADVASAQRPVFTSTVDLVEVDVRVEDESGRPVVGLDARDFVVSEDGAPQQVTTFVAVAREASPVRDGGGADDSTESVAVASNLRSQGRLYLFLLDDLHVAPARAAQVRLAARSFVERYMGDGDIGAVALTSGRRDGAQAFTADRRRLVAAIEQFSGQKLRSATMSRIEEAGRQRGTRPQRGAPVDDPLLAERGMTARVALDALRAQATGLSAVKGRRKSLLYFSEGVDYDISDPFGLNRGGDITQGGQRENADASVLLQALRDAVTAAASANVVIYGIDARGLAGASDDAIEIGAAPVDHTLGLGNRSAQDELRASQSSLQVLAEETGGTAVVNRNVLDAAFEKIVRDNSAYYVLGYSSSNVKRDGRFRTIAVRTSRRDYRVIARRGYSARKPTRSAPAARQPISESLRAAFASPVPVSGLPLEASATVFRGSGKSALVVMSLLVGLNQAPLEGTERDLNTVDVFITAQSYDGKVTDGGRVTVPLRGDTSHVETLRATGLRVVKQFALAPGRQHVQVVVTEHRGGRAGSVHVPLDIPDFTRPRVALSELALTSTTSTLAPTVRAGDVLADVLPGPPTTFRDFPSGDELTVFAETYLKRETERPRLSVEAVLRSPSGDERPLTVDGPSGPARSAAARAMLLRVPLQNLAPGRYRIRLTATLDGADAGGDPTTRELAFNVSE